MLSREWCERLAAALPAVLNHQPAPEDWYYPLQDDQLGPFPCRLEYPSGEAGAWVVAVRGTLAPPEKSHGRTVPDLWIPTVRQLLDLSQDIGHPPVLLTERGEWVCGGMPTTDSERDEWTLEHEQRAPTPEGAVARWLLEVVEERRQP